MEEDLYRVHAEMEDQHWWFVARRRILSAVVGRTLANVQTPFLIDIGCGTGASVAHFMSQGYRCVGIDSSETAIMLAREKFPTAQFRCGPVMAELKDIAPEATLFTLLDVLEHVEDDKRFLRELIELAPSGTNILLTVPALKSLWSPHDVANRHFRRYEKEEFRATWRELPVECRMIGFFNAWLYPVIRLARGFANLTHTAVGEGGSDFAMPNPLINHLLTSLFESETATLIGQIDDSNSFAFPVGASLMAILRKS